MAGGLAAVGCWLLWRNKQIAKAAGLSGKLVINETKSLGSKQYLVVASYGSQKFLLGVCPGKINLLTPLNAEQAQVYEAEAALTRDGFSVENHVSRGLGHGIDATGVSLGGPFLTKVLA